MLTVAAPQTGPGAPPNQTNGGAVPPAGGAPANGGLHSLEEEEDERWVTGGGEMDVRCQEEEGWQEWERWTPGGGW